MTTFNCYFWEIQVGVSSHLKDMGSLPGIIIYIFHFCKPEIYDILKALCIALHQEVLSWLGV